MGQSSSTNSKTALPSANLLIDASDSYVTDIKLRSSAIIPISEYIKKDKCSKNLKHSKLGKKNTPEEKENKVKEKDVKKGKLETIEEEIKDDKNKKKNSQNEEKHQERKLQIEHIENLKKEKQHFIESSYEDIPDKRKWVNIHPPKYIKSQNESHVKNRKTQTKIHRSHNSTLPDLNESVTSHETKAIQTVRSTSTDEITQIYKNNVYPHIYKNRYKKRSEEKEQKKKEQKKMKETEPIPMESNIYFSKTDTKKMPDKNEESTHQLTQHHFKKLTQFFKKTKHNLVVQTNVACVIHPNKRQRYSVSSSDETVKKPINITRRYLPTLFKKQENTKKYNMYVPASGNNYESSSNTSTVMVQRKIDQIDKVSEEHRKFISARQALANWKNIHTLKQHRKLSQPNYETYQEENHKNPYTEDRYNVDYDRNTGLQMEFIVPPRSNRSRAGYRERSLSEMKMDRKMTPLEISNYNYSKFDYKSPKERNQRMAYKNSRDMNQYERPGTPRFEYMKKSAYGRHTLPSRHQNYDSLKFPEHSDNHEGRPIKSSNYKNNPMPDISEREERDMDKTDFIADIERCLQKHQKMATVYGKTQNINKSTWVQDRYRRWHKVVMD